MHNTISYPAMWTVNQPSNHPSLPFLYHIQLSLLHSLNYNYSNCDQLRKQVLSAQNTVVLNTLSRMDTEIFEFLHRLYWQPQPFLPCQLGYTQQLTLLLNFLMFLQKHIIITAVNVRIQSVCCYLKNLAIARHICGAYKFHKLKLHFAVIYTIKHYATLYGCILWQSYQICQSL